MEQTPALQSQPINNEITNSSNNNRKLIRIAIFLAILIIVFCGIYTVLNLYLNSNSSKTDNIVSNPEEEVPVVNDLDPNVKSDYVETPHILSGTLANVELTFDRNKYRYTENSFLGLSSIQLWAKSNNKYSIRGEDVLLEIIDFSQSPNYESDKPIEQLIGIQGSIEESSFENITIFDKEYEFSDELYIDTIVDGDECFLTDGYTRSFIMTDEGLGVFINNKFNETGCRNQPPVATFAFDEATVREAVEILKSLRYTN